MGLQTDSSGPQIIVVITTTAHVILKMAANLSDCEFVKELQDDLMCSICMKVLNEPQMVNCCEQRFCKNCLTKWMTNNKTCPHCRSTDFNYILLKRLSKRISALEECTVLTKHMAVSPHLRLMNTSITSLWIMLKDVSSLNYPARFNVVLIYFVVT